MSTRLPSMGHLPYWLTLCLAVASVASLLGVDTGTGFDHGLLFNPLLAVIITAGPIYASFDKTLAEKYRSGLAIAWVAYGIAYFIQASGADWDLFYDQFLNHEKMSGNYHILVAPLFLVFEISLYSCLFSTLLGLLLAVLRSGNNVFIDYFVTAYVVFFRAIPAMVLVVLVYFALPFVGIGLVSTTSVIVSLSVMFGAYTTEIFRSGIESVSRTQIEAAKALGLSAWQTLRYVILPQALRIVIPPLTGVLIDVLKTTSIAYVVGVPELIARARQLEGALGTVTPLIFVSLLYLMIVLPMVILSSRLEKRSRRWSVEKAL